MPLRSRAQAFLPIDERQVALWVWNNRQYEVTVLADGYELEGRTFRSLSTVAREITKTRWNSNKDRSYPGEHERIINQVQAL